MDGTRFMIIHNEELRDINGKPSFASCSIIVDRRTGVNYLQPSNGGLTVLVRRRQAHHLPGVHPAVTEKRRDGL